MQKCGNKMLIDGTGGPEPFFYSIDITDALTQWTEFDFIWCRGGEAVRKAVGPMLAQFPFKVRKVHPDGGGEFVNEAVLSLFAARFGVQLFEQRGQPFTRFGVFSI